MLSCRREGGDMGTSGAIWDDCSALDRLRSCPPRVMLASLANSRARVAAGRRELPYYVHTSDGSACVVGTTYLVSCGTIRREKNLLHR
jgi:hypothetical protein